MYKRQVIAKAQDDLHAKVLKKVGADRVVFPERDMGVRLAHQLQSNSVMDLVELSEDYSLVETSAPEAWWNQTLGQLNLRRKYELTVAAIKRADGALLASPGADDYVYQGDLMVLIGANETFQNLSLIHIFASGPAGSGVAEANASRCGSGSSIATDNKISATQQSMATKRHSSGMRRSSCLLYTSRCV